MATRNERQMTRIDKKSAGRKASSAAQRMNPASEAALWAPLSSIAENSVKFWNSFLDLRNSAGATLSSADLSNLLKIVRAVSWVESRHGTGTGNQPAVDPMQCGNPSDAWWPQLAGQSGNGDRFVRGPNYTKNFWAAELPNEAASDPSFPANAKLAILGDVAEGHRDAGFSSTISFRWGVPHLIWKTNVPAGRKAYQCGEVDRDELIAGAVAYNGGGNPNYEDEVRAALTLIGWPAAPAAAAAALADGVSVSQAPSIVERIMQSISQHEATEKLFPFGINKIDVTVTAGSNPSLSILVEGPAQGRGGQPTKDRQDIVRESWTVTGLDLAPKTKAAAESLKTDFGNQVTFTSGRRSLDDQATVMAQNIVKTGDRKWIEKTYIAGAELQKWVDDHPEATTEGALRSGLAAILQTWDGSKLKALSYHLIGAAFDLQPVAGDAGQKIQTAIGNLPALRKFLQRESGVDVWHLEFME